MKSLISLYLVLWFALIALAAANSINLQTQSKGIAVEIDGKAVANASTLNLSSGSGIVWACTPGPAVTCTANLGITALTKPQFQSGACDTLSSTIGTTTYAASLQNCQVITKYVSGMHFLLTVDTTCAASCTITIDNVVPAVAIKIKRADGTYVDPAGALVKGLPRWIFYDGTVFVLV